MKCLSIQCVTKAAGLTLNAGKHCRVFSDWFWFQSRPWRLKHMHCQLFWCLKNTLLHVFVCNIMFEEWLQFSLVSAERQCFIQQWRSVVVWMQLNAPALHARQFINKILFCLLSTLFRKLLCQAYVNRKRNDEIDSSRAWGDFSAKPERSGLPCWV